LPCFVAVVQAGARWPRFVCFDEGAGLLIVSIPTVGSAGGASDARHSFLRGGVCLSADDRAPRSSETPSLASRHSCISALGSLAQTECQNAT
jgi:hypothetical protein